MKTPQRFAYRGYTVYYDPPPVPTRRWDWHFYNDEDPELGMDHGPTPEDCMSQIDDLILDREEELAHLGIEK
jgi:hypothetical protein